MFIKFLSTLLLLSSTFACASVKNLNNYPSHWWEKIPESQRQGSWEILPHEVKKGELILSKRNELGIFSNLAYSPFILDGVRYASVEALWQMMKYPDSTDPNDIRSDFMHEYPYSREQVYNLSGFESKKAGDMANAINKKYGISNMVSYEKHTFDYKDHAAGSKRHFAIIKKAITAKVLADKSIYNLLLKTKGLKLLPDHKQGSNKPPAYFYHKILMDLRDAKND